MAQRDVPVHQSALTQAAIGGQAHARPRARACIRTHSSAGVETCETCARCGRGQRLCALCAARRERCTPALAADTDAERVRSCIECASTQARPAFGRVCVSAVWARAPRCAGVRDTTATTYERRKRAHFAVPLREAPVLRVRRRSSPLLLAVGRQEVAMSDNGARAEERSFVKLLGEEREH
eukprot:6203892-Pleurochrysis_carterae.AAC.1